MPRRGEPCVRPYINGLSPALSFRAKRRISFLFRGEIPHYVRNDKGGIRNDKHSYLRPFAKFAFGLLSFRAKRRISFRYFWLDPKVTKKSRLRALRTPSRRLQVGKSGNSLPLFPPLKGGAGGMSLCVRIPCIRHNIIQLLMVNC